MNSAYLNLFLPFWWEYVLLCSLLDEAKADKLVMETLARLPPPAYAPPLAARQVAPSQPPAQLWALGFAGKPIAPLIIGTDIGLSIPIPDHDCDCAFSVAFPGRQHYIHAGIFPAE